MVPPMHLRLMCHPIARAPSKWHPTASTLCPTIKKCWSYVTVMLKTKRKCTTPENFLATGGCFERITYCVTALRWLKKERKKQDEEVYP